MSISADLGWCLGISVGLNVFLVYCLVHMDMDRREAWKEARHLRALLRRKELEEKEWERQLD